METTVRYSTYPKYLTHAKSRLIRFVIEVLTDLINSVIHFFKKNKLFEYGG